MVSASPATSLPPNDFAQVLLQLSLSGVLLLRPLYDPAGQTITDWAWVQLNPAAQQLLKLPECPVESLLTLFPAAEQVGVFSFYCEAFWSGQVARRQNEYLHDGLSGYYSLVAQRYGEVLVVSFTEANDQPRSGLEETLRASRASAQAARAAAEQAQQQLYQVLMQLPANIVLLQGADHVFTLVNPSYQQLFPGRPLLHLPVRQALPELAGQGFFDVLDRVYQTGEPFYLPEAETWADFAGTGQPELRYYSASFLPFRNGLQEITGVLNIAFDVTAQVWARRQVEQFNEALELRVTARSAEARAALHEAEHQRELLAQQQALLAQILRQVPAAIATLSGPEHRFTFFNDLYQTLVTGRARVGLPVTDVLPEVAEQGFIDLLDRVYATGQPFSGTETLVMLHDPTTDQAAQRYVDLIYQPLVDRQARPQGILAFILDVTDRVRARKQADTLQAAMLAVVQRQAQARQDLYQVFEQTPVAIVLLREPNHRIDYFNPAFEELFPPEAWAGSLLGHTLAEVYPYLKTTGVVQLLDQVFATGESQSVVDMPLADLQPGSPRYLTFAYQAYREQDRIIGVAAFVYDVTERVLARRHLEAQQAELQRIFEQAPVAICVYRGPEYIVEFANPTMLEVVGADPTRLLGRPLVEFLPDLDRQGLLAALDGVRRTGQPFVAQEMPLTFPRSQKQALGYFNFVYQPLPDAQGHASGIICVATEVTDQVLVRQEVEATARQLRLLTDALPVLIGYLDHTLTYRFNNRAYQDWFGQDPAALLGRPVREVVGETAFQTALPRMTRALAGERVDFDAEMPYRADFVKHIHTSYVPDVQAGQVLGFYTLVLDVTDQVLARQQVQRLNEELAATNEELSASNTQLTRTNADLDTFVYSASHDLKSPITNIEGLLLALREHLPPEAWRDPLVPRLLGMMDGAVARFQQTLEHLTDVSRLQQANLTQPPEEINLPALVEAIRLDILPELTAAGATLTVDLTACPTVRFSPKNLRSILYNLLSNAVKYQAPDRAPVVQLRGYHQLGQLVLEVQDNGLGLSAEQQGELFRLFRRLHDHVPGSGVGLYMVKKMVENAGGTLAVQSQPGVGSTFFVSLPHAD